jgi:hypothetical protein
MEIVDFTKQLGENENTYLFNPSLAHYKDNLYLCLYRKFVRFPELKQKGDDYDYSVFDKLNINHPWLGGPNSSFWWKSYYGFDKSGIAILSIDDNNNVNITNLQLNIFEIINGIKTSINSNPIKGVDARLLHLGNGFFVSSYNTFLGNRSDISLKEGDCGNWCGLISTRIIEIKNDELIFHPEVVLCPEKSNRVEKNWSFWLHNKKLSLSYGLENGHEIFQLNLYPNKTIGCTGITKNKSIIFFNKFKKYYKNKIHISVTTPAISFNDIEYIGVGHIKYKYENNLGDIQNTKLSNFTLQMTLENKKFHPIYVYLMFFYTFNPVDGGVTKISNMFLPQSDYVLCFPSGISKTPNNSFLISYGDSDVKCRFFKTSYVEIVDSLYDINNIIPNDIDFKML